ncbi:hypothetical protein Taro_050976 [Colocasia esculenta]|uniref:Disease resistance N-terminal domain-containing protein n=1 Tax=Colocasia esculenta TaxID=4460 RepID=A0A843XES5_COLES|nr:hypothetical protein [Colocasia esculenta]
MYGVVVWFEQVKCRMWTFKVAVAIGGLGVDANLRLMQLYLGVCPRLLFFFSVLWKFGYVNCEIFIKCGVFLCVYTDCGLVSLARLRPVRGRWTRIKYVIGLTGLAEAFRHTYITRLSTGLFSVSGKNGGVLSFSGTGLEQVIEKLKQVCRIPKEIQRLVNTMNRIIAALKDAEKKQISSEAVRLWLWELKQVVFDAEDLIDELATGAAVPSMGSHTHNTPTITPHMMCQIREMNDRLDLLEPQIPMLGLQLSTAEDSCLVLSKRRQMGSLLPDAASAWEEWGRLPLLSSSLMIRM